jgi:hypothetical protein
MISTVRFVWRQYRFELASVIIAVVALTVAAALNAFLLNETRPLTAHLDACTATNTGLDTPECADVAFWLSLRDAELTRLIGVMPFVAGVVLGSVLVSREIEHRSAQLGWSLSGSRAAWLMERVIPIMILIAGLLGALAVASELLEAARQPAVDPRSSLHEYGNRGLSVVMRGLAAFGIAVLAGAVTGRQLPALLLSGAASVALAYGLVWAFPYGAAWHWVAEEEYMTPGAEIAYRRDRSGFRAGDGTILTYEQALEQAPDQGDSGAADDWIYANYEPVTRVLRGNQLVEIEAREALALAGLALFGTAASLVVVDRRRPY